MDQQGTPLASGGSGTKNTSTPAPPRSENAGPVASDSLAAESSRDQGVFSENKGAAPSSVKGSSSTLANDDTSAARTIPPAPDAEARESQEAWGESSKLKGASGLKNAEGVGGQSDSSGAHTNDDSSGGPGGGKTSGGGATSSGSDPAGLTGTTTEQQGSSATSSSGTATALQDSSTTSSAGDTTSGDDGAATGASKSAQRADPAPTYVGSVTGDFQTGNELKPKGTNLTEGGFDADQMPNASFSAEIGSENDPGRVAEHKFQRENAQEGMDAGRPRQTGVESGGAGYGNLETDQQA